ncbi:Protein of unknown function [Pyronema omphalodes CBS 100304]|uniref:Uncharacterized protein n=1 Tax=Pyronema omphalodes (strain CBS 100304) TaxID=1076935 RepID=U4L584_PYROM|nr:Protein of unknown function [Pyronema omphalodes CBS 100304]
MQLRIQRCKSVQYNVCGSNPRLRCVTRLCFNMLNRLVKRIGELHERFYMLGGLWACLLLWGGSIGSSRAEGRWTWKSAFEKLCQLNQFIHKLNFKLAFLVNPFDLPKLAPN